MKKPSTPFPTTGYYGGAYFCDRQEELSDLTNHLRGASSTTLVSLRRMGKTALIRHFQSEVKDHYLGVYVDILPTESMSDLLNSLASGIAVMESEQSGFGKQLWKFLKSLRPIMSYDSLSGVPSLSFNKTSEEGQRCVQEIFAFLESLSKPVILAIDEFQQILNYPEKMVDAWLRTLIQELKNVHFIFSGSQQHLMNKLFADPSRPFYRSTQFLKIGKIPTEQYQLFIAEKFREHSKLIDDRTIESVLEWSEGYTYYVQLLCNRIFLSSGRKVGPAIWKEEALRLMKEQEFVFYSYREGLTSPQWRVLKGIAREGVVKNPTSGAFISTHHLGSSATVLRSLTSLLKKELIFRETGSDGISYYGVYDILFKRWIQA